MRYVHLRYFRTCDISKTNDTGVSNLGGVTIAYNDDGWTYTICRENENFCRKEGRKQCHDKFEVNEFYPRKEATIEEMIERVYAHIEKAPWFGKVIDYLGMPYYSKLKYFLY